MNEASFFIKILNSFINFKRKLNDTLSDKPSFYIKGWNRMGLEANIEVKVINKEKSYCIIEKIIFETIDGARSELNFSDKISKLIITLPNEEQFYDLEGFIKISYKLKNNSRHISISPKIITAKKAKNEFGDESPLNILNEIHERYFI